MKRNGVMREAFNFDDVLLVPAESQVKPEEVTTKTRLTRDIELFVPLISAGLDYVTESKMAIALAQLGGLGVIHDNMPLGKQVEEVRRVKRAEGRMVMHPITIAPDSSVAEAIDLMTTYRISGLPVVEGGSQKVVGIITNRDVRFFEDYAKPVSELMTAKVVTAQHGIEDAEAKRLMHENRIEKLVVLDEQGRCAGLITVKDFEKLSRHPHATRDIFGRLRVGAAVSLGKDAVDRASAMADAGLDVVFVDAAHGHMREVAATVSMIRQQRTSEVQIVAGNVVTADAARSLADAGADAVKVGIGAGRAAASRRLAGVGMPQLTAVLDVVEQCDMMGLPVIVDGGVLRPSDFAKAIAAGAESVMVSDIFAGTDEAPGKVVYQDARAYKVVNPEAKSQHRPQASTFVADALRLDEDAVDTSVPYRGPVAHIAGQMAAGLRTAMAYTGCKDIAAFRDMAELVRAK